MDRLSPEKAAGLFVDAFYPKCKAALLAGSTVRGEETEKSDLDIIIFDDTRLASYRESLIAYEWPVEVFVYSLSSYQSFFERDVERARPSLPRMVAEGVIIKGWDVVMPIKAEADYLLNLGPEKWTEETIRTKRYFLTDTLDDFIGSQDRTDAMCVSWTLADKLSEFVLRTNRKWIGSSKWMIRSLKDYDPQFATRFIDAFDRFYTYGDKESVIQLTEDVLQPFGGRLFEGFVLGEKE
ncbi:nucleotidyltransferase domain-containing protein [Pontibacillus sp. HN14]|uniref:Nucleotidyltransferase domain-containing protein n=2 Tax=Bacillaceae TaxID=186817 RepID=A0ABY8V4J4_9BACI|nr:MULTISPECIES: nucleotidyltransferase domain-containing protein [Pontibacillus]MCD5324642.1 nucleotidyltransferase domain-containing protein [Pontibacillus sp. HN14]WIG00138.1 nucleotidyltransferase domain-containing protein [Pontibacillus chungwhensis]